jgi:hypothetical protein
MAFSGEFAERIAAGQPLLDFYFHSYSSSAGADEFLLTLVPSLTIAGNTTLSIAMCEENAGGAAPIGSPLTILVKPGALVSANLAAPNTSFAGDSLTITMHAQVSYSVKRFNVSKNSLILLTNCYFVLQLLDLFRHSFEAYNIPFWY